MQPGAIELGDVHAELQLGAVHRYQAGRRDGCHLVLVMGGGNGNVAAAASPECDPPHAPGGGRLWQVAGGGTSPRTGAVRARGPRT